MSLKTKLDKIEAKLRAATNGECGCEGGVDVRWYALTDDGYTPPDAESAPRVCGRCGLPQRVLIVELVEPDAPALAVEE